jgi:formiminoglutamase
MTPVSLAKARIALPDSAPDDPRLGHLLGRGLSEGEPARVTLVGFAVDQGVERNGGRIGAREGPLALRERLYRLCPDAEQPEPFCELVRQTRDLGDLVASGDLEHDQAQLAQVVGHALAEGSFVIVLGGGHETTYGHFLGYVQEGTRVAIHNIDAHPDVRPLKRGLGHSGSPFRQALEHPSGACVSYRVEGLQPYACPASLLTYLNEHAAPYGYRRSFAGDTLYDTEGAMLATFCLDAVDQAFAPGVSAPSSDGLWPAEWLAAAYRAGSSMHVRSADVVELNPRLDRDVQTARLAAHTVWELLRGIASRGT